MTDEEVVRLEAENAQIEAELAQAIIQRLQEWYAAHDFQIALVKAGYRAAMAEVHDQFVNIRRKKSAADACEEYGNWLQVQVKKE